MHFDCPLCQDTGYIGNEKCCCFKQKIIERLYAESNIRKLTETANFDLLSEEFYQGEDLEHFKNAMSEILISFSTNTSRFQSVIDLRREIYEKEGGTAPDEIEQYIKNNKTLSKYHVLYGAMDSSQEQDVLAYGTNIGKTYSELNKARPSCFDIVGFDESNFEFEYSYTAENFDWSRLKDEE